MTAQETIDNLTKKYSTKYNGFKDVAYALPETIGKCHSEYCRSVVKAKAADNEEDRKAWEEYAQAEKRRIEMYEADLIALHEAIEELYS